MKTDLAGDSCWSTSSLPFAAESLPKEQSVLGEHLEHCRALTGRLFALRCWADAAHRFVASRFVTTALVSATLVAVSLSVV